MQLMLTRTTQSADILALTIILLQIPTHCHNCTHQPLSAISSDISSPDRFLPKKGNHTNYYQTLTPSHSAKCDTFLDYPQHVHTFHDLVQTTCIYELLYFFLHPHFHISIFTCPVPAHPAFRIKTLCTNLEICHTILPQIT